MPDVLLPTVVLALKHATLSATALSKKLRTECEPPIIVRIQNDELLIDPRTVEIEEMEIILNELVRLG